MRNAVAKAFSLNPFYMREKKGRLAAFGLDKISLSTNASMTVAGVKLRLSSLVSSA